MTNFEKMIGVKVTCDYAWDDEGIVRIEGGRHNNFQFVMGYDKYIEKLVGFCNMQRR